MTELIETAAEVLLYVRKEIPKHTALPKYAPKAVKRAFFVPETKPATIPARLQAFDFKFTMTEGGYSYSTPIVVAASTEGGAFKKMRKLVAQLVTYIQICNTYNMVIGAGIEIKEVE